MIQQFAVLFTNRNIEITRQKNADYTGGTDPYANFKMAIRFGVNPRDIFIARICDKVARINTGLQKELIVKDETILDSISDLANYAMLFGGYLNGNNNLIDHAKYFYDEVCNSAFLEAQPLTNCNDLLGDILDRLEASLTVGREQANYLLQTIAINSILIAYYLETKNLDKHGAKP